MVDNIKIHKPLWLEVMGTLLTPLVIAIASYYVTFKINEQQQVNAQIIARTQMQNAIKISEGEVNVAKLDQIKDLFSMIFVEDPKIPKKQVILSLPAYGMTALPFLTRALEYSEERKDQELIKSSKKAINLLLGSSQLSLSGVNLAGQSLRNAKFQNLDFRNANFSKSNLYKADLNACNLVNTDISDADLFLADFSNANLSDANLTGSNVRRAKFTRAKLDRANFQNARHVEDAEFTPSSLKDALFTRNDIIKLIKKYREEIDRDQFGEDLLTLLREKYELTLEDTGG
jgi:hypothetical protein